MKELAELKVKKKPDGSEEIEEIYRWNSLDDIRIEFRPKYFVDEGFEDFALFQSENFVERQVFELYEDRWLEVYTQSIDQQICEVKIVNDDELKHIKVFTPIHVLPPDYQAMWTELSALHLNFHRKARDTMETKKINL